MRLHSNARRANAPAGERGETLIELIATVFLLGIVIVGLMSALLNVIIASSADRRHTRAGTEATSMVEKIRVANYSACGATSPVPQNTAYRTAAGTAPTGYTYALTITFLASRTAATSAASPASFGASCPGAGDQGAQRVMLTMTSLGRNTVTESLILIKRRKP